MIGKAKRLVPTLVAGSGCCWGSRLDLHSAAQFGCDEGLADFATLGLELSDREGEALGPNVGCWLGMLLGLLLGSSLGCPLGCDEGLADFATVGPELGNGWIDNEG